MKTELDKVLEWYQVSSDSLIVMKELVSVKPEVIPLKSVLVAKKLPETKRLLDMAFIELNHLAIVSLVSTFEQILLEYLKQILKTQIASSSDLEKKINNYAVKQSERWHFNDVLELYKPPVEKELVGMVKQIYSFRSWVAHGKQNEKTPPQIDPITAYNRLSEFLNKLYKIDILG
jgi:elongation factor P--beta-lysine ligase